MTLEDVGPGTVCVRATVITQFTGQTPIKRVDVLISYGDGTAPVAFPCSLSLSLSLSVSLCLSLSVSLSRSLSLSLSLSPFLNPLLLFAKDAVGTDYYTVNPLGDLVDCEGGAGCYVGSDDIIHNPIAMGFSSAFLEKKLPGWKAKNTLIASSKKSSNEKRASA